MRSEITNVKLTLLNFKIAVLRVNMRDSAGGEEPKKRMSKKQALLKATHARQKLAAERRGEKLPPEKLKKQVGGSRGEQLVMLRGLCVCIS
jgi:hypothetical protein